MPSLESADRRRSAYENRKQDARATEAPSAPLARDGNTYLGYTFISVNDLLATLDSETKGYNATWQSCLHLVPTPARANTPNSRFGSMNRVANETQSHYLGAIDFIVVRSVGGTAVGSNLVFAPDWNTGTHIPSTSYANRRVCEANQRPKTPTPTPRFVPLNSVANEPQSQHEILDVNSCGAGANWYLGEEAESLSAGLKVNSRTMFDGTVTATDMDRATDAREKGRIGIFGTGNAYAGSSGRVTSERIGRDLNPLGRGDGSAYVGGDQNYGRIAPTLPKSSGGGGWGNSVNNGCGGGGCGLSASGYYSPGIPAHEPGEHNQGASGSSYQNCVDGVSKEMGSDVAVHNFSPLDHNCEDFIDGFMWYDGSDGVCANGPPCTNMDQTVVGPQLPHGDLSPTVFTEPTCPKMLFVCRGLRTWADIEYGCQCDPGRLNHLATNSGLAIQTGLGTALVLAKLGGTPKIGSHVMPYTYRGCKFEVTESILLSAIELAPGEQLPPNWCSLQDPDIRAKAEREGVTGTPGYSFICCSGPCPVFAVETRIREMEYINSHFNGCITNHEWNTIPTPGVITSPNPFTIPAMGESDYDAYNCLDSLHHELMVTGAEKTSGVEWHCQEG